MDFSYQQDIALQRVSEWLKLSFDEAPFFYLGGYAGTGKTTLAVHLASGVTGGVAFAAYTGKAAHVMRRKGCFNAKTIHSLIYVTHDRSPAELIRLETELKEARAALKKVLDEDLDTVDLVRQEHQLKHLRRVVSTLEREMETEKTEAKKPMWQLNVEGSDLQYVSLVIIDECSMVDTRIAEDLLSFGKKILVLGDPAQLPPVGGEGYFTRRTPDFVLTEIHRQAAESPILRLATAAREKQYIPAGQIGDTDECVVMDNPGNLAEKFMAADQILVGKNVTRHASNARCRTLLREAGTLGPGGVYPVEGDKLVCLRNNHEVGLLNGSLWRVHMSNLDDLGTVSMRISSLDEETEPFDVAAHPHYFEGREKDLNHWQRRDAEEFDYGYALTVHKAQGSQWDSVVLVDQSGVFREDRWKWLYTGITRAAKRLLVVR